MIANKHSIGFTMSSGQKVVIGLSDKFVDGAPKEWEKLARQVVDCCNFLEQFKLAGHFTFGVKEPLSCVGLSDITIDLKDVYAKGTEIPVLEIPASLTLCIYAGLVYITDNPEQYAFESDRMKYVDSTEAIGWKDHTILSVDYKVKGGDIAYGIFIYRKDEENVLKHIGSYSAFEEKLTNSEGKEISAPKEVEENFRRIYGKADTLRKIKELNGEQDSD